MSTVGGPVLLTEMLCALSLDADSALTAACSAPSRRDSAAPARGPKLPPPPPSAPSPAATEPTCVPDAVSTPTDIRAAGGRHDPLVRYGSAGREASTTGLRTTKHAAAAYDRQPGARQVHIVRSLAVHMTRIAYVDTCRCNIAPGAFCQNPSRLVAVAGLPLHSGKRLKRVRIARRCLNGPPACRITRQWLRQTFGACLQVDDRQASLTAASTTQALGSLGVTADS